MMLQKIARRVVGWRHHIPAPIYKRLRRFYRSLQTWHTQPSLVVRAYATDLANHVPLQPNHVLYESFHGKSFNCSPAAICMALLDDPAYAHLTHIWAINDPAVLPATLTAHPNVRWVDRQTAAYGQALATAGTIISNTTLGPHFIRREGQVYANTWHGG